MGEAKDDYTHAEEYITASNDARMKVGTLSKAEWEAVCKYRFD